MLPNLENEILEFLKKNGKTIHSLALEIGVTPRHLYFIFSDDPVKKRVLGSGLLEKINNVLGTDFKKEP
jgi:lambda repressor-like predicted transcriptional regulator